MARGARRDASPTVYRSGAMSTFPDLVRRSPARCALWALAIAACGDNFPASLDGPALGPAATLFVSAHFDDDLIFMQPELVAALAAGPVTTVYVISGDPKYGLGRTDRNFGFARIAYSGGGAPDWDCGYILIAGSPAHHCRLNHLSDRPISLIGLDIPDGGPDGLYDVSPLNLVEGDMTEVPILGWAQGTATKDSIIASLAELITVTGPADIHALDLAATHGGDHSSHLFSSAFAFWAAARVGYAGRIHWHRGYNVGEEPITLEGGDYEAAKQMLGFFDACYFGCGPCGTSCLHQPHDNWLKRQYSSTRAPLEATGTLALEGDRAQCLSSAGGRLVLADCAGAAPVRLDAAGHLTVGGACIASARGAADPVVLEPCSNSPAQYWVSDSEGHVWNGSPPEPAADMAFDHIRCLSAEPAPGAIVTAPICGSRLSPAWQINPGR
jgi:hypothetical protein